MIRAALEVLNTCPNVPSLMLLSGIPNVGVLNALKNSARNSTRLDSVIGKTLKNDRSKLRGQSARKALRPVLPNVYAAGAPKAAGFSHWFGVLFGSKTVACT